MKTQAISAPVDRLTREAPKRQVGYGLPCAKCHKYFPADLEVCPICKGRERVSPVVAPRIPKPVRSETSVAPSSANLAVKPEVKESPTPESKAFAPPVEIKVKDRDLDQKEPITVQVVAELPVAAEPARSSLVSTLEEKEPPKFESPAFAVPVEVHAVEVQAEDQTLTQKKSITIPALTEVQGTIEPVSDNVVTANDASLMREMESPTVATSAAGSIECPCLDQRLESIVIPAVAEAPPSVTPLAENIASVRAEDLPKELETPAFSALEQVHAEDLCLNDQSKNDQPNDDQPRQDEAMTAMTIPTLVEAQASKSAPIAIAPMREEKKEEELATALETPAAVDPIQITVEDYRLADQHLEDQRRDQINEALRIVIPMLVEAQASDPAPTDVAQEPKVGELPNELESPALDFLKETAAETQRSDATCHAEPIVIPMLVETQASEPALVAAEPEMLEQEEKEQAPEIPETPISTAKVKIVEAKVVEVKTIEPPAVFNEANHRPAEEKSKAIDKGVNTPTKPADVNAPVVVHVNLGELQLGQQRAPKSTPDRAPALARLKEIERTEPETSSSDIASDVDASEPPALVSGRRFDLVTFALGVVVLACAVLLITLAALRLMPRHASEPVRRAKPAYSIAPATADQNTNASIPTPPPTASGDLSSNSPVVAPTPAQPPAASASKPSSSGSERVLTLAPGLAEGNLLYRVEPDYPEEARRQGVQGPVVLDLHISKDGLVQGVDLVSGQPLLVQAATAAVKQWRFRTRYVNGNEVEMQARITLHFALPTP